MNSIICIYINTPSLIINSIASDGSKIYLGGNLVNAYIISSVLNTLTVRSDILVSTITMNAYVSGQADSVVSGSVLPKATTTYVMSTGVPPTLDTTSTLSESIITTDVQYYVSSVSFTELSSKTSYTKSVSLTWSTAGTTSISYSLISYNGQTLPSWVSLDTSNQQIKFTTPWVTTNTTYQFAVQATISGTNTQTPVSLTVTPPSTG